MRVEFLIEVEGKPTGVAIDAACVGNLEARAKAAAVRLADDAESRGQHALVFRLQKRWYRSQWVDGRREMVYDTAGGATPGPAAATFTAA